MKFLLLTLILLVSSVVCAEETPKQSRFDTRIQYVDYNEGDVVRVRVRPGTAVRIVFSKEEQIIDVASGFTQGWELLDRGNILYLKARSLPGESDRFLSPVPPRWNTNLLVTTSKRLYDFDLQLIQSSQVSAYRVQFRYPKEEALRLLAKETKAAEETALEKKYPPKNWYYSMQIGKRSEGIVPKYAYDDGNFTYLKFPNNREFPAVFLVSNDKKESLVNSHIEGDVLVVHRVAKEMVLRFGKQVVGIYNERFDQDGIPPENGVTSPLGLRTINPFLEGIK